MRGDALNEQLIRRSWDEQDSMYAAHNRALIGLANHDSRIVTCYADFPSGEAGVVFKDKFPDRIIDVGIAEAHLITSAAGLADAGYVPFTHCHGLFALGRGYNQIRQNVAYDDRNVKIVLCNCGAIWGDIGPSHVSVEDIAALRAVPNLVILSPSDPVISEKTTMAAAGHIGPMILRMPFVGAMYSKIYEENVAFEIGRALEVRRGEDVTIISTGILLKEALEAAQQVSKAGIQAQVLDMTTIKPLDEEAVLEAARETGAIVTVEDGSILGGLGGAVAEVVSEVSPVPMKRIGIRDEFGESGKPEEIKEHYGLTSDSIAKAVYEVMRLKG
jgi:transketolase